MLTTLKKSVSNASTMSTEGPAKPVAKTTQSVTKAKPSPKGRAKAVAKTTQSVTKAKPSPKGRAKAVAKTTQSVTKAKPSAKGRAKPVAKTTKAVAEAKPSRKGRAAVQKAMKATPTLTGRVTAVKAKKTTGREPQPVKQGFAKKGKAPVKPKPAAVTKTVPKTNKVKEHGPERLTQFKSKMSTLKRQKLRREKVPETNFALRDFPWSPWKILASSEPRKTLHPVYRQVGSKNIILEYTHSCAIFKGKTKQPVLYEFAVKPLGYRQKKIVYAKICPRNLSYSTHWYDILTSSKSLKWQIENIIRKQGGDIYFRRLVLKKYKRYENVPSIVGNYDYVWAPEAGATKYREFKKDSYVISEEMDVN